jgi:hypothetical protein
VTSAADQLIDTIDDADPYAHPSGEIAHLQLVAARERAFHPDTVIFGAGGTKGTKMPSDYRDQIYRFYGETHRSDHYGMTELICGFPKCTACRYHQPPWIVTLVLDQTGEHLLDTSEGQVEGRAAFFDIGTEARWGGVISGDRITVEEPSGRIRRE